MKVLFPAAKKKFCSCCNLYFSASGLYCPENRIWIQYIYIYISFSFGCREVWVNCVSLVYDLLSIRDFWRHWESHVINGASGIVCWRAELSSKALSFHTISSLVILVAVFCLVTLNQANHISIIIYNIQYIYIYIYQNILYCIYIYTSKYIIMHTYVYIYISKKYNVYTYIYIYIYIYISNYI